MIEEGVIIPGSDVVGGVERNAGHSTTSSNDVADKV